MNNVQAKQIIEKEKLWESNERVKTAFDIGIKALETIEKIKDIIREEEHYEVSNSLDNPHPNKADYNVVHTDKFNRIWKVISEAEENKL